MRRTTGLIVVLIGLGLPGRWAFAADVDWGGLWVTDEGAMTLVQEAARVRGTYGRGAELEAQASGAKLEGTYRAGDVTGRLEFEMQEGGRHFTGKWIHPQGGSGIWRGWKQDEGAPSRPGASFAGFWLTSLGSLDLEQKGSSVSGPWRNQGWATIAGDVQGRRLDARLRLPTWNGKAWLELTPDGKRLFGLTDEATPAAVIGLKVEDFSKQPRLKAGEIAQGISENGLLYFLRPPDGWKKGKAVDAIVLLHGSNWTTKGMLWVTARNWPELAKDTMIVGIQGDQWAAWSEPDDLRFNYHYVNWMGKSTYQGYPFTERDSPQLVSDVVAELAKKHAWKRVFLGGHSQGGFLSYLMAMHFPEQFAGVFPVAGGLVMQAEPDAFADPNLKAAQRALPLAIVHGTKDTVVGYETSLYVRDRFEAAGFPRVGFINPDLGHPYDFLPIGEVFRWLDAMSTTKPEILLAFAQEAAKQGRWRDVGCALERARVLKAEKKLAALADQLDAAAAREAADHQAKIEAGAGGEWVDAFFEWKRQFATSRAAAGAMAAWEKVRAGHDAQAATLIQEARQALGDGNRDLGRQKYEQVLERCFLSGQYPIVKRWVSGL